MKHTAVNKMIKWIVSMRIQKLLIQIFHLDIFKIGHNIWSASTHISRDAEHSQQLLCSIKMLS